MLEAVKAFFASNLTPDDETRDRTREETGAEPGVDPVALAACALLLELAYADEEFADSEREHIEEALLRHFDMAPDAIRELMTLAERERGKSVDLYQFTRLIAERYDLGQKMVLAEVMWRVVYADGELAKHESYLMRKISNLLGLKPGYLADARKRVTDSVD